MAVLLFRRISNPSYRDLANTDYLTGCKSRNAFEVDLGNLQSARRQGQALLVSIDLNGLKKVNDTAGHAGGDELIRRRRICCGGPSSPAWCFTGWAAMSSPFWRRRPARTRNSGCARACGPCWTPGAAGCRCRWGAARFDPARDKDLLDTYRRADLEMYGQKRRFYGGGRA